MAPPIHLKVDRPVIPESCPTLPKSSSAIPTSVASVPIITVRNTSEQPKYDLVLSTGQVRDMLNGNERVLKPTLLDRLRVLGSSETRSRVLEKRAAIRQLFELVNPLFNKDETVDYYTVTQNRFDTMYNLANAEGKRRFDTKFQVSTNHAADSTTTTIKFYLDGQKRAWVEKRETTQKTARKTIVETVWSSALSAPESRIVYLPVNNVTTPVTSEKTDISPVTYPIMPSTGTKK